MRVSGLLCVLLAGLGGAPAARASRHHHETRLAFRNEWTVKVDGAAEQVQQVADQLGLHNAGALKGLRHVYRLVKTDHPESSAEAADHITNALSAHPKSRRNTRPRSVGSQAAHNTMNVLEVMEQGVTGRGVGVVIIDDGVEHNHTDIAHAYDPSLSYDIVDGDRDPSPRYDDTDTNAHGTKCAGIVSMQPNNDFCGVGMATGARLGAVRLLDGVITDRTEGEAFSAACLGADVISVSWGPTDSGYVADMPGRLLQDAIETCIEEGRQGRGVILVWASGNGGGAADDNCACDGYASSPFTLSVGSVDQEGRMPWYGEICSSTLAVTYTVGHPNNVITTAMHDRCTSGFSGTSASAPMAASMVALMLEVNPQLTWRDVQHLVVYTSRPEPVLRANSQWVSNAIGLRYSTRVGFGLMDAAALVAGARTWNSSQSASAIRRFCQAPGEQSAEWRRLGSRGPVTVTLSARCDGPYQIRHLEHVELVFSLNYTRRGALRMRLTSPQGTTVTILRPRRKDDSADGFDGFKLMSVATCGENPDGKWMLEVRDDTFEDNYGELQKLKLILWGTAVPVHKMTALPPEETTEDDDVMMESSGETDSEEAEKSEDDPTPEQQTLNDSITSLTKSSDEAITNSDLLIRPEDEPHLNIGRHTEIGAESPPLGVGRFTELVEDSPVETVDRLADVEEGSRDGSGEYMEYNLESDVDPMMENERIPFRMALSGFGKTGRRYGGEKIGRFADYGSAWLGDGETRRSQLEIISQRLQRDGRKHTDTALLDRFGAGQRLQEAVYRRARRLDRRWWQ
ncbi:neuroendocrine convertase 1-like isoform X2 [Amphibalanus amphitrite]|uniref:neuroendocrine convertase 1-like isoform X2 n=1 Tax=Amphibalanus amphitrite TaxID=1232801 RepID=UPI001C91E2F4|nr:neuroendocrine convertase 1-like isoform X2 [Amphibalanus amphitrite]